MPAHRVFETARAVSSRLNLASSGQRLTQARGALLARCAAVVRALLTREEIQRALGAHAMLQRVKEWPQHTEQFCSAHRVMETNVGAYTDCYECGHVYQTYEDLREAHAQTYRNIGGKRNIGIITYCPLCLHDF